MLLLCAVIPFVFKKSMDANRWINEFYEIRLQSIGNKQSIVLESMQPLETTNYIWIPRYKVLKSPAGAILLLLGYSNYLLSVIYIATYRGLLEVIN